MKHFVLFALILSLSGCQANLGTIPSVAERGESCKGIYVSIGATSGPCTLKGGEISIPGATLLGGLFVGMGDLLASIFGSPEVRVVVETDRALEAGN